MGNSNNMSFLALMGGILVGGAAGFVSGLLVAPRSGQETRLLIQERTGELQSKATGMVEDTVLRAEASLNEMARRVEELQARSHAVMQEGQKQLTQAVEKSQQEISDAVKESRKQLRQAVEHTRKAAAA